MKKVPEVFIYSAGVLTGLFFHVLDRVLKSMCWSKSNLELVWVWLSNLGASGGLAGEIGTVMFGVESLKIAGYLNIWSVWFLIGLPTETFPLSPLATERTPLRCFRSYSGSTIVSSFLFLSSGGFVECSWEYQDFWPNSCSPAKATSKSSFC